MIRSRKWGQEDGANSEAEDQSLFGGTVYTSSKTGVKGCMYGITVKAEYADTCMGRLSLAAQVALHSMFQLR